MDSFLNNQCEIVTVRPNIKWTKQVFADKLCLKSCVSFYELDGKNRFMLTKSVSSLTFESHWNKRF